MPYIFTLFVQLYQNYFSFYESNANPHFMCNLGGNLTFPLFIESTPINNILIRNRPFMKLQNLLRVKKVIFNNAT